MDKVKDFKITPFIEAAKELLRADETERALNLLANLDAYHRDFPPIEVTELRNHIHSLIATPSFYATTIGIESDLTRNVHLAMDKSLRGGLLLREVKRLNDIGKVPHIEDLGPGEAWAPALLKWKGLKFTYKPVYLNHDAYKSHEPHFVEYLQDKPLPSQPVIAFACEIIEHLWHEEDLRYDMISNAGRLPDIIHISTPAGTFDHECMDWESKGRLGHLRAYTPTEFFTKVQSIFPEFNLIPYMSKILHVRGVLASTQFMYVKESEKMDLFAGDPLSLG